MLNHTEHDWEKLVFTVDGEEYGHELQPDGPLEDALCETCHTDDPNDPHAYGPKDEKIGKGFSYWYDISRRNFIKKHYGQGTRFYATGGVTICSMCIAQLVDRADNDKDFADVTYRWKA